MRAGATLDALAQLGPVDVIVVPVHGPLPATVPTPAGAATCTVVAIDHRPEERLDFMARLAAPGWRDRAARLHPRPVACRPATMGVAGEIAGLVDGADLVVVYRLYLAPFLDVVLRDPARPVCVLDVDDVESSTWIQLGELAEAERYDRLEREYLPLFDRVLAAHEGDARDLSGRGGVRVDVVPNGVALAGATRVREPRWDLLFVGNMSYRPNAEAAAWLCDRVLPDLPSARVALVGCDPPPAVEACGRPGRVHVSGTVDDVSRYYAGASVAVVPLLAGGGTSIKVLEAFAHGRPVVSTSVGARGLPVVDGEHLLLADDPSTFAAACRRLLADPALAAELAGAGRELVRRSFTTGSIATLRREVFRAAVAAPVR
jgi:glycosyltransferase involved in cell wall biosynthesis